MHENNLNKIERTAVKQLVKRNDTFITETYKGDAVVISL